MAFKYAGWFLGNEITSNLSGGKLKEETICAIDLTDHPDRLLEQSRVRYNLENKEFVKKGGIVKITIEKDGDLVSANLLGDIVFECKGILKYDPIAKNFEICVTDNF